MDLVYRVGGDGYECALFAKRESAERVSEVRRALRDSQTWGEFRASLPSGEWAERLAMSFEEVPGDDEPFDADDVPGCVDGDYPEWLLGSQLDWFPKSLVEKYGGTKRETALNGDALELPADKAALIADDLRALGYSVELTELDIS